MGRIDDFKEFIINELNPPFKVKRDIINCESESQIIDIIPQKFNDLQKEFGEEWDKSYLFGQFTTSTDFIQVAKKFIYTQPLYYDSSRIWWIWNFKKSTWKHVDETDILNLIDKYTKLPSTRSTLKTELLEALKRVGRQNKPKDVKPTWVQFKHKIIDIETGKEFDSDPKYFVTNPIPWDLGTQEDTPILDKIFEEWVGKEYVQTLYEIIAYSLIPSYPIHRLFCLIGSGMNGKSKYLELISKFVGTSNVTTTELDTLLDSRFEIGRLHKKLVCLVGETNFSEMKKTSILKKLTGGDLIGFEYKGKDPFEDYNYAKIVISTNNLPTTSDKTIGFYRRWLIIDFPNRFNENKDIINDIPEEEYNNLAKKSINVIKNLLSKRVFSNEGSVEDRMKKFEDLSNPLDKFLQEMVVEDFESWIPKYEFKNKLSDWCEENRFRRITDTFLGRKMKEMGIETVRRSAPWHSNEGPRPQIRSWDGLKWKDLNKDTEKKTDLSGLPPNLTQSSYREVSSNKVDTLSTLSDQNLETNNNSLSLVEEIAEDKDVTSISSGDLECKTCGLKNVIKLDKKGNCEYCKES